MSDTEDGAVGEGNSAAEVLLERHRKEKKDLQAKVTNLRRSIPKGDKKRKKDITAEIERLESELRERHRRELSELNTSVSSGTDAVRADEVPAAEEGNPEAKAEMRISKANKRREKKALVNRQRAEAEQEDKDNAQFAPGKIELEAIGRCLAERHLSVFEIPADGDCLYNAIAHQHSLVSATTSTGVDMRRKAGAFIRSHKEDFMPFLTREDGEPIDEFEFDEYCGRVERSCDAGGHWGGEPELRALSSALERRIEVIQPEGRSAVFGDEFASTKGLTITFHRFAYRLGEHYNSTISS